MNWNDILILFWTIIIGVGIPVFIDFSVRFLYKKIFKWSLRKYRLHHYSHHRTMMGAREEKNQKFKNVDVADTIWRNVISFILICFYFYFLFNRTLLIGPAKPTLPPKPSHPPVVVSIDSSGSEDPHKLPDDSFIDDSTLDAELKANYDSFIKVRKIPHKLINKRSRNQLRYHTHKMLKPQHYDDSIYLAKIKHLNTMKRETLEARKRVADRVKSRFGHHIPKSMEVGVPTTATVILARSAEDSVLLHGLSRRQKSAYVIHTIAITTHVQVKLTDPTGDNFKIDHDGSTEEQVVSDSMRTMWRWHITPLKSGNNNVIELNITTKTKDELGEGYTDIPAYDESIYVKANQLNSTIMFFQNYWQYIIGTFCIPVLLWARKFFKDRKAAKNNKPKTIMGFIDLNKKR